MEIKREIYLNKLIARRDNNLVKVVTGLRRCGKTYLLKNLYKDYLLSTGVKENQIIYIALDRNENAKYRNPMNLDECVRRFISNSSDRCYVIIDEIQYSVGIPNPYIPQEARTEDNKITFYDTVLGLMDECDLYITGSNSEMLSSDILTNFRGRGDEVRVYPLSYSEYLQVAGEDSEVNFRNYLYYGGMPLTLSQGSDEMKKNYLKTLFDKTYIDDIIARYNIKNKESLESILDFIASTTGSLVNPTNIANAMSNNDKEFFRNTVSDYLDYAENSFLISKARRFDIRGKDYVRGQQKYYFTDIGLRNCRLNFRQFDLPHLLENIVYNELITRGYSVDVGRVQTRIKNKNGDYQISYLESDFVVNDINNKMYIQVTEGIDDPQKKEQEMNSLLHIRDGFPKIILVNQNIPRYVTEEGIIIMSIREFLLTDIRG